MNDEITDFCLRYDEALAAKRKLDRLISDLVIAAAACKNQRDHITQRLRSERPDLVSALAEAYSNGERMKDEMMKGVRWPKVGKEHTNYRDTLNAVPEAQRSPEIIECLKWWTAYASIAEKIELAFPAPPHFHWNGFTLQGPNLYSDFGIATRVE